MPTTSSQLTLRPPVVAVMGHIDHGKSSLLDYIRKTNIVDKEVGGITQKMSAYEVSHQNEKGEPRRITFLDTPGHEAFNAIRSHGARVADIAILVVSGEEGVKPQTIEAFQAIKDSKLPYIVAITKIDKPEANIERTQQSLAEHEIYVEGYGGDVPFVGVSAKTGEGIPELLDIILLLSELQNLQGDPAAAVEGVVIESVLDKRKGVSGTIVIKNGTLHLGDVLVAGTSIAPGRILEDFTGKKITEATFSSPVRIIGWSELPPLGSMITKFDSKKEAEKYVLELTSSQKQSKASTAAVAEEGIVTVPLIVKANVSGGLEAIEHELAKITAERVRIRVVQASVGDISEADVKLSVATQNATIVGFATRVDPLAQSLAERLGITIHTFDIIYKLSDFVRELVQQNRPLVKIEEVVGEAKLLKVFSSNRDKHIVGGRVESGVIKIGSEVKILRRGAEIARGKIRELQQQKEKASEVGEGHEFGMMIESKIEVAPGDRIECIQVVEKQ
jgi:translation initiation factor IF-2